VWKLLWRLQDVGCYPGGQDYSITFSTYFNVEWVEKRLTIKPEWAAEMGLDNSSGNSNITFPFMLKEQ
jgi:hypothetical protein